MAKSYADPRVVALVQKRWDEIPPPVDKKKRMYSFISRYVRCKLVNWKTKEFATIVSRVTDLLGCFFSIRFKSWLVL